MKSVLLLLLMLIFLWQGMKADMGIADDGENGVFAFQNVIKQAKQLAAKPYRPPEKKVPDFLLKMGYDDWRDIRFRPEEALWSKEKLPFTVQFFHPGLFYDRAVAIHVVDSQGVRPLAFSRDLFDYGKNDFKDLVPEDLGFAGFRIHYPINTPYYSDEVVVFLGATYLRAVAQNQNYGLSARALAIDTATATGEEFPYFKKFWLLRPTREDREMIACALVDTPSLVGAYRFVIQPGKESIIEATGRLFMRRKIEKLCLAPLTSMFFYGEILNQRPINEFRPEVHDSDGLLIATGEGEWVWRPLSNPRTLQVNSFQTVNPVGFGLIQRDQEFDHYQDLEAHYQTRTSVWVSPLGKWGTGRIELVQIPTENEFNDNVTAYWVPSAPPKPGESLHFDYRMIWHSPGGHRPPGGRVAATRIVKGKADVQWKFLIDFEGNELERLPADKPLTAVITLDPRTRLIEQQLYKNSITKGWRLVFQLSAEGTGSVERLLPLQQRNAYELRAFLKLGEKVLTETWSYAHFPE